MPAAGPVTIDPGTEQPSASTGGRRQPSLAARPGPAWRASPPSRALPTRSIARAPCVAGRAEPQWRAPAATCRSTARGAPCRDPCRVRVVT